METTDSILVVGAGALGGALVRGMAQDPDRRQRIQVLDAVAEKAQALATETGTAAVTLDSIQGPVATLLLVVKPPDVEGAVTSLRAAIGSDTVVVSCAAGISLASITYTLGGEARLIRAMPNVAARVQASTTVLVAGSGVPEADLARTEALFASVGQVLRAPAEEALHAVTALAASGPAFLALLLEAFIDAGVAAGLARPLAEALCLGMARGTLALLDDGTSPAELRAQVTSPAGTTAAGLAAMESAAARGAVGDAIQAAAARSRELLG